MQRLARKRSSGAEGSDSCCAQGDDAHLEFLLDTALEDSFPASDPVAVQVVAPVSLTRAPMNAAQALVCTIGHSNRALADFIELLHEHGVTRVLDVRTVPRSRHNPHFAQDALPDSLREAGIGYTHLPALGGLRRARPDSPNGGWRNASFRGYADYMQTVEFQSQVDALAEQAPGERCALMCAEAVPWRCHRSLIADALMVRGVRVEHIIGPKARKPHALTRFAVVAGTGILYPAP